MKSIVSAILTQPISYTKLGVETTLPKGKLVKLDIDNNIAYVNGDCVQLVQDDYKVYMN
jgi:hypothetical protein